MGEEKTNDSNPESKPLQNTSEETSNDESEEGQASDDDRGLVKIVKDMGVIGLAKILTAVSGIILLPVLTRYLGAYGYGLWSNVNATLGLALPILLLGLHEGILRMFPAKEKVERGKDLFSIVFVVSAVTVAVSAFLFLYPQLLANLVFEGEEYVVRFVALLLFVWCLDNLFLRSFQAFREMKKYTLVRVLTRYSEISFAIFLVVLGYGLYGALLAVLIVRTVLLLIFVFIFSKRFGVHCPSLSRIKNIKSYFNYGAPLIPNSLAYWVINTSDRYLIAYFLGVTYVGYYAPAYTIGRFLPFILGGMVYFVLKPTLSEFYDNGGIDRVKKLLNLSMKYTLLLSIPFFFGILLFHHELTALLTTGEIAREGSFIAIYTALGGIIYLNYRFTSLILILLKKTKVIGKVKIFAALINIIGNIILIPVLGILAAALTTIASYTFFTFITYWAARGYLFPKINLGTFFKIIGSSAIMYISLYALLFYFDPYFLYLVPIGIVIYFAVLTICKGISKKEIQFLKKLL